MHASPGIWFPGLQRYIGGDPHCQSQCGREGVSSPECIDKMEKE